ncbi:MAG: hypothetical protein H7A33_02370 [Deltaproteobacteria bacterium]|nr:hypothetical protein [Deltaproteobacteria bacterium]
MKTTRFHTLLALIFTLSFAINCSGDSNSNSNASDPTATISGEAPSGDIINDWVISASIDATSSGEPCDQFVGESTTIYASVTSEGCSVNESRFEENDTSASCAADSSQVVISHNEYGDDFNGYCEATYITKESYSMTLQNDGSLSGTMSMEFIVEYSETISGGCAVFTNYTCHFTGSVSAAPASVSTDNTDDAEENISDTDNTDTTDDAIESEDNADDTNTDDTDTGSTDTEDSTDTSDTEDDVDSTDDTTDDTEDTSDDVSEITGTLILNTMNASTTIVLAGDDITIDANITNNSNQTTFNPKLVLTKLSLMSSLSERSAKSLFANRTVISASETMSLSESGTEEKSIAFTLPSDLATGRYSLSLIFTAEGNTMSVEKEAMSPVVIKVE